MLAALLVFVLGSRTYRYGIRRDEKDPYMRIGQAIFKAVRNHRTTSSAMVIKEEARLYCQNSQQFKFLNQALSAVDGSMEGQNVRGVNDVDETKSLLRLIPIWTTSMAYAIVFAQTSTFFTEQGATVDRTIFPGYQISAASLQSFIGVAIIVLIPIYDRILLPMARAFTKKPTSITMLP
uniref:Protein NRT1/ PTR FAMILY 5.10 n=1 Tax=Rhizophora mucronata TaxID=61149 RepID=A0A2P2NGB9_RHIMU